MKNRFNDCISFLFFMAIHIENQFDKAGKVFVVEMNQL